MHGVQGLVPGLRLIKNFEGSGRRGHTSPGAAMARFRRHRLATQDCYSRKATMGRQLMSPITDRTMRIPSGVASPITTNHAVTGSVFVKLTNPGNLKIGLQGSHLTESRNGVLPPQRTQPLRLQRLRTRVEASGYSVQGSGCKVQGSGFRV